MSALWEEYGFTRASLAPVAEHQHRGLLNQVSESASDRAALLSVCNSMERIVAAHSEAGVPAPAILLVISAVLTACLDWLSVWLLGSAAAAGRHLSAPTNSARSQMQMHASAGVGAARCSS